MDRTMVAISFENRTMIMRTKKNYFVSRNLIDKRERERERERKLPTFLDTLHLLLFMFIRMIYI